MRAAWLKTLWTTTTGSWNTVGELVIGYVAEWTHTPFVQVRDLLRMCAPLRAAVAENERRNPWLGHD